MDLEGVTKNWENAFTMHKLRLHSFRNYLYENQELMNKLIFQYLKTRCCKYYITYIIIIDIVLNYAVINGTTQMYL